MARNTETVLNKTLGDLLISRHPGWNQANVHIERTGTLQANPARQVDVLVESALGQPVAIEAEFEPAWNVESEATGRLNEKLASSGRIIESAISVKYPSQLRQGDPGRLQFEILNYATHQLDEDGQTLRWPQRGWVQGDVDALADAIESVSLSERLLAEGANISEQAVHHAASQLRMYLTAHTHGLIAETLHQQDGIQTTRMAVSIVASAFVFHRTIEGQPDIPLLQSIRDEGMSKSEICKAWRAILSVNYWPIFSIALEVLAPIPDNFVWRLAETLDRASGELAKLGATTFHDLAGRTFQTLISDRKFLATFYTLPSSACLLAELAVDRLHVDWKDPQRIAALRIADLACGTGALLSAVQRSIYRRHRRSGGNDYQIHRSMMERALIGMDIMPAATHITASMLSSACPGLP